jgi:hypothetical protein
MQDTRTHTNAGMCTSVPCCGVHAAGTRADAQRKHTRGLPQHATFAASMRPIDLPRLSAGRRLPHPGCRSCKCTTAIAAPAPRLLLVRLRHRRRLPGQRSPAAAAGGVAGVAGPIARVQHLPSLEAQRHGVAAAQACRRPHAARPCVLCMHCWCDGRCTGVCCLRPMRAPPWQRWLSHRHAGAAELLSGGAGHTV